jgi:DNA-binding MarR family transcriptional regulator
VSDELLRELTGWSPRERIGTFRAWHRGALSLIHLHVVTVLEADGPMPMSKLAEALDVSVASATGIVDRMEHRGLVERRHASDDRRVVLVGATSRGKNLFRMMDRRRRVGLARLLEHLTPEEQAGFLLGLRGLRAARAAMAVPAAAEANPAGAGPPTGDAAGTRPTGEVPA